MSKTTELLQLKQKVERMEEDKHKAEGALEQVMSQIETDFECKNLDEAKKLLHKLKRKVKHSRRQIIEGTKQLEKELAKHEGN